MRGEWLKVYMLRVDSEVLRVAIQFEKAKWLLPELWLPSV